MGGSILYIEARASSMTKKDKPMPGQAKITGSIHEVMKESAQIAHTYAKNFLATYLPNNPAVNYLQTQDIHLHVPEGAVPKV